MWISAAFVDMRSVFEEVDNFLTAKPVMSIFFSSSP